VTVDCDLKWLTLDADLICSHRFIIAFVLSQIFAIDLVSYLSLQYALPKSLTVAKIAVNVMGTMLGGKHIKEIIFQVSAS
jgi:Integrator complex subunit 2